MDGFVRKYCIDDLEFDASDSYKKKKKVIRALPLKKGEGLLTFITEWAFTSAPLEPLTDRVLDGV
jgi:hypothetical protein